MANPFDQFDTTESAAISLPRKANREAWENPFSAIDSAPDKRNPFDAFDGAQDQWPDSTPESLRQTLIKEGRSVLEAPIRFERGIAEKAGDVASGTARALDIVREGDLLSGDAKPNLTIMQHRQAYEQALKDPRYAERLMQAGDDAQKLRQVEGTFGPTAKLDIIQTPEKERARISAETAIARQARLETDSPLYQWGREQVEFAGKVFKGSPDIDDTFVSGLAQAAGGVLPDVMLSAVPVVGPSLTAGSYAAQSGEQQAQEAIAAGKPEATDTAFVAAAGLGGLSERLIGFAPRFWSAVKSARVAQVAPEQFGNAWQKWAASNPVKARILEGGAREGIQEGPIEQVGQNLIASNIAGYDPERPIGKGVGKATLMGAALGGIMGGAGEIIGRKTPPSDGEASANPFDKFDPTSPESSANAETMRSIERDFNASAEPDIWADEDQSPQSQATASPDVPITTDSTEQQTSGAVSATSPASGASQREQVRKGLSELPGAAQDLTPEQAAAPATKGDLAKMVADLQATLQGSAIPAKPESQPSSNPTIQQSIPESPRKPSLASNVQTGTEMPAQPQPNHKGRSAGGAIAERARVAAELKSLITQKQRERDTKIEAHEHVNDEGDISTIVSHPDVDDSWTVYQMEGRWIGENNNGSMVRGKTKEEAITKAQERVRDDLKDTRSTFGGNMDNMYEVAPLFEHFDVPSGMNNLGWGRTKWGSWYGVVEYTDRNGDTQTFKLSVRDHEPSRKDMGLPDKYGEVSKDWSPDEVSSALTNLEKWLVRQKEKGVAIDSENANTAIAGGAAGIKTPLETQPQSGATSPQSANPVNKQSSSPQGTGTAAGQIKPPVVETVPPSPVNLLDILLSKPEELQTQAVQPKTDSRRSEIHSKINELKDSAADWNTREYKENKTKLETKDEFESERSIGSINEIKRAKRVRRYVDSANSLKAWVVAEQEGMLSPKEIEFFRSETVESLQDNAPFDNSKKVKAVAERYASPSPVSKAAAPLMDLPTQDKPMDLDAEMRAIHEQERNDAARAAQEKQYDAQRKKEQSQGITEADGILHILTGQGVRLPYFAPGGMVMATYKRLKNKLRGNGILSSDEKQLWNKVREQIPDNFEDQFGVDGYLLKGAYAAAEKAGIASAVFARTDKTNLRYDNILSELPREMSVAELLEEVARLSNQHLANKAKREKGYEGLTEREIAEVKRGEQLAVDQAKVLEDFGNQDEPKTPTTVEQSARAKQDEAHLKRIATQNPGLGELQNLVSVGDVRGTSGQAERLGANQRGSRLISAAERQALRELDRVNGTHTILVDTPGDTLSFHGFKDRKSSVVLIHVRTPLPLVTVYGHELSHHIELTHPGLYREGLAYAMQYAKDHERFRQVLESRDQGTSDANLERELFGDFMGDAMSDPAVLEEMRRRDPNLFKRLTRIIRAWMDKLLAKLKGAKVAGYESEQYVTDLQAMRDGIADILVRHARETQFAARGVPGQEAAVEEPFSKPKKKAFKERLRDFYLKLAKQEFPAMPDSTAESLADYLVDTTGVMQSQEMSSSDAMKLAVRAYIRHRKTSYESNFGDGVERGENRAIVGKKIDEIYDEWRAPKYAADEAYELEQEAKLNPEARGDLSYEPRDRFSKPSVDRQSGRGVASGRETQADQTKSNLPDQSQSGNDVGRRQPGRQAEQAPTDLASALLADADAINGEIANLEKLRRTTGEPGTQVGTRSTNGNLAYADQYRQTLLKAHTAAKGKDAQAALQDIVDAHNSDQSAYDRTYPYTKGKLNDALQQGWERRLQGSADAIAVISSRLKEFSGGMFSKPSRSDFSFDAPESVSDQKARLAAEKRKADEAKDKATMQERAGARLTGSDLDTTREMFGQEVKQDKDGQLGMFSKPTGIKNAAMENELADVGKLGLPGFLRTERKSNQTLHDTVTARIADEPGWIDTIIEREKKQPSSLTDEEVFALSHRLVELSAAHSKASRKAAAANDAGDMDTVVESGAQANALSDKIKELADITKESGTIAGRALQARARLFAQDFSLVAMEAKKREANDWAPLTPEQRADIQKQHDAYEAKIAELEQHLEETTGQLIDEELRRAKAEEEAAALPRYDARVIHHAEQFALAWHKVRLKEEADLMAMLKDSETGGMFSKPTIGDRVTKLARYIVEDIVRGVKKAEILEQLKTKFGASVEAKFEAIWSEANSQMEKSLSKADKAVPDIADKIKRVIKRKDAAVREADARNQIETMIAKGEAGSIFGMVQKLIRSIVEQNRKVTREGLIDEVHNTLKEFLPEITRLEAMDAISGRGRFTLPSSDEVSKIVHDLKAQTRLVGHQIDVQAKRPLPRTGFQPGQQSDAVRREAKILEELKRKFGVVVSDPMKQLASVLTARKTYYKNRLADMAHEIKTRELTVKTKSPEATDTELEALKAEYKALKAEHAAIFTKPELTDAQRLELSEKAADRHIAELERQLRTGEIFAPGKKPTGPTSAALEAKKARIEALKAEREWARDLLQPKPEIDRVAQALKARQASLTRQIADYADRLARGDFAKRTRKVLDITQDPKAMSLMAQRDAIKQRFEKGVFDDRMARRTRVQKIFYGIRQSKDAFVNIMSSGDLSAPRQLFNYFMDASTRLVTSPGAGLEMFKQPLGKMFQAAWSEDKAQAIEQWRLNQPNAKSGAYKIMGIEFSDLHAQSFSKQEEFAHSILDDWAALPFKTGNAGKSAITAPGKAGARLVRVSNRAFISALNVARVMLANELLKANFSHRAPTDAELRAIGNLVNLSTGRGAMNTKVASVTSTVLWSPKLAASRLQVLIGQPLWGKAGREGGGTARKMVLQWYVRQLVAAALLATIVRMFKDDDDDELSSSDAGKVQRGRTRIDPWMGYAQFVVLADRLIESETTSATTGKTRQLSGGGNLEVIGRFLANKTRPDIVAIVKASAYTFDKARGEEKPRFTGEEVVKSAIPAPLALQEVIAIMRENGMAEGAIIQVLAQFGVGVSVYEDREKQK